MAASSITEVSRNSSLGCASMSSRGLEQGQVPKGNNSEGDCKMQQATQDCLQLSLQVLRKEGLSVHVDARRGIDTSSQ